MCGIPIEQWKRAFHAETETTCRQAREIAALKSRIRELEQDWTETDEVYAKIEDARRDAVEWLLTHGPHGRLI